MTELIHRYVRTVCIGATTLAAATYALAPVTSADAIRAAAVFFALAVLAELLAYELPGGAQASIAYIPLLSGIIIAPTWTTVAAVALAQLIPDAIKRRGRVKTAFNTAQITVAACLAVLLYRSFGQAELLAPTAPALTSVAQSTLLPVVLTVVVYFAVNSTLVTGAIAFSTGRGFVQTWRRNTLSMLTFDVLASPIILFLAWLYAKGGFWGALLLVLPMYGFRQLYATNARLSKVNHELLELMVMAIEARDPYTSGHSRRVSHYARIIGRALGMGQKDVERIATAALLHDVGKIHESFAPILRKPGKLSPEEWAIMQTHAQKSAELVGTVSHLRDLVAAVLHHHENWDGSGYPDGLSGDAIPIESRIIIFADMIDAMTTDRPYRRALGETEVRAELIKCRGQQFDPTICDKLLASPAFPLLFQPLAHHSSPRGFWGDRPRKGGRVSVVA